MPSWVGTEGADLEYEDEEGILTDALVEKRYLTDEYSGRRPRYYLEVKTTPGHLDSPFFMSGAQYQKVGHLRAVPHPSYRVPI